MTGIRTAVVLLLVVGLVIPAGVLGAPAASNGTDGTVGAASIAPASAATVVQNESSNNSSVSVGVGQQLSTVIAASESDVSAEVEESAFEASLEGTDERQQAEAIAERAEELRERAAEISEDYREATREYENGEISRSEYAQRLAVLNARAKRVLAAADRLEQRADDVSALELATVGLNRTALRQSTADLDNLTGTGPSALLERFTGQRRGEVELERADGLSIEVEGEDGERSREVERDRDDDHSITVEQSAALETARGVLSEQDGDWALERASVHPESGYYRFRFALVTANETGEAEVRVDGSTGEVFRVEEEIERRDDESDDDEQEVDELAIVVVDGTPAPGETVTVRVVADGEPVANATVTLNGDVVGETAADGTLAVSLPTRSTELAVTAGGEDAELEFEFDESDDEWRSLVRNVSTDATLEDGTVTVTVTYDGSPVENVSVVVDGRTVGTTGADGTVAFETAAEEELEVTLRRGEFEAELEYRIVSGSLVPVEVEPPDRPGPGIDDLELRVASGDPGRGETITLETTADGEPVANATVTLNGDVVGETAADGTLAVTLPETTDVELVVTKDGESADREYEFDEEVDSLDLRVVSGDPAPGATITVEVTGNGDPIAGAAVSVEGDFAGQTDSDGNIEVTLPEDEDDPRVRAWTEDGSGRIEFDFDDD